MIGNGETPTGVEPVTVLQAVSWLGGMSFRRRVPGLMVTAEEQEMLQRLATELREPGEHRAMAIQVEVSAGGRREVRHAFGLSSISPCQAVVDPDYRYPNHPRPPMARPAGIEPGARPTDPEVLARVRGLVGEFTAYYRRLKHRDPEFGQVSTEEELAAAEREIGLRLPDDVRALYLLTGADPRENGLLGGGFCLYPLRRVVDGYIENGPGSWGLQEDPFDVGRVVFESVPFGTVRRVSRNDWWVVVGTDNNGNECAVDLDPGPGGRSGQLIASGRGYTDPVAVLAGSVVERLAAVVEALRRGDIDRDYLEDDEEGYEDDDRISVMLRQDDVQRHDVSLRNVPADLASVLPADTDAVQLLYLNDAETLDLRALSATPHVRELSINRAGTVELWLPPLLEALSLEARHADLSALAGHPELWDLTVKGLAVSVEQLAAVPALARLDVSEATVDDVEALADLDIRVLVLNGDQWQRLRARDRLPGRLAAAEWTGHTMLDEAADWTAWISSHTPAR